VRADLLQALQQPVPVVERALGVAGMMLGTDKYRGYCLEMICADFLAAADIPPISRRASEFNEPSAATTPDQTGFGGLPAVEEAGIRTRWLAVPGVRFVREPADPSLETEK
jgi:hypothetical protein